VSSKTDQQPDSSTAMVPAPQPEPTYGYLVPSVSASSAVAQVMAPEPDESVYQYLRRITDRLAAPGEDVSAKIAAQILDSGDFGDENAVWDSLSGKDAVGKVFRFNSLNVLPSDYEESKLGFFLVCQVTDMASGEDTVLSTGAFNVCTQLLKAFLLGNLPAVAEIVAPKRMPKSGKVPLRLRWIVRVAAPQVVDVNV